PGAMRSLAGNVSGLGALRR
ncbi:hypothetical protein A2U01_0105100, partial [Trifolium medium]|nr:hypothetical protein [Trifolium medium]